MSALPRLVSTTRGHPGDDGREIKFRFDRDLSVEDVTAIVRAITLDGPYAERLKRALLAVRVRVANEMGALITLDMIDAALAKNPGTITTDAVAQSAGDTQAPPPAGVVEQLRKGRLEVQSLPASSPSQCHEICTGDGKPCADTNLCAAVGSCMSLVESQRRREYIAENRIAPPVHSIGSVERNLAESWGRWHDYKFASIFRDILCRTLDKAEIYAKRGKPLPSDEIEAMTARLVEATEQLDALGRPVQPHRSGGGDPPVHSQGVDSK